MASTATATTTATMSSTFTTTMTTTQTQIMTTATLVPTPTEVSRTRTETGTETVTESLTMRTKTVSDSLVNPTGTVTKRLLTKTRSLTRSVAVTESSTVSGGSDVLTATLSYVTLTSKITPQPTSGAVAPVEKIPLTPNDTMTPPPPLTPLDDLHPAITLFEKKWYWFAIAGCVLVFFVLAMLVKRWRKKKNTEQNTLTFFDYQTKLQDLEEYEPLKPIKR